MPKKRSSRKPQSSFSANGGLEKLQKFQEEMQEAQAEITASSFEGQTTNAEVKVVINGKNELTVVDIKEELLTPDNKEIIDALVLNAYQDALSKLAAFTEERMGKYAAFINGL